MKPRTTPVECNGRPQLWWVDRRIGLGDRLRIIYPDGKVEYAFTFTDGYFNHSHPFSEGCTGSPYGQLDAQEACLRYSWNRGEDCYFLGYL